MALLAINLIRLGNRTVNSSVSQCLAQAELKPDFNTRGDDRSGTKSIHSEFIALRSPTASCPQFSFYSFFSYLFPPYPPSLAWPTLPFSPNFPHIYPSLSLSCACSYISRLHSCSSFSTSLKVWVKPNKYYDRCRVRELQRILDTKSPL